LGVAENNDGAGFTVGKRASESDPLGVFGGAFDGAEAVFEMPLLERGSETQREAGVTPRRRLWARPRWGCGPGAHRHRRR